MESNSTVKNYYETQQDKEASIVAQVIIKAVADMVSSGNIKPEAFKTNARVLVEVYKETKKGVLE
jgi:hypothetical protein